MIEKAVAAEAVQFNPPFLASVLFRNHIIEHCCCTVTNAQSGVIQITVQLPVT